MWGWKVASIGRFAEQKHAARIGELYFRELKQPRLDGMIFVKERNLTVKDFMHQG